MEQACRPGISGVDVGAPFDGAATALTSLISGADKIVVGGSGAK